MATSVGPARPERTAAGPSRAATNEHVLVLPQEVVVGVKRLLCRCVIREGAKLCLLFYFKKALQMAFNLSMIFDGPGISSFLHTFGFQNNEAVSACEHWPRPRPALETTESRQGES